RARKLNTVNSHFRFVSGVRLEIAAQSAYSHQGDGDEYSHQYVSHSRSLGQAPTSAKSGSDWIHFCHAAPPQGYELSARDLDFFHKPVKTRSPKAHFYLNLHNGWTFLPDNSLGHLPLDDCAFISDDKFDFTEDKAAEAPFDANKVLTVFHNGAGDYL